MLGARDLEISVDWKFEFLPPGSTVSAQPGTVFADLGNRIEPGVIDHHGGAADCHSTASAIVHRPHLVLNHLLGPIVDQHLRGDLPSNHCVKLVFATHESPDWDGLCSLYLCRHLVKHGVLPRSGVVEALSHSVDIVDQGRAEIGEDLRRAFLVYQVIKDREVAERGCDGWRTALNRGLDLLDMVLAAASAEGSVRPDLLLEPHAAIEEGYADEVAYARHDFERFCEDIEHGEIFQVMLQTRDGNLETAKVFAFTREPSCHFAKYWVRERVRRCDALLVPGFWDDHKTQPRFIISVPPQSRFRLHRLGFVLEREETQKRARAGDERLVRDGAPRWDDPEYSDNSDPWYDGRGHHHTIVDSPSSRSGGTCLSYPEIRAVMESPFASVGLRDRRLLLILHSDPISPGKMESLPWQSRARPFEGIAELSPHVRKIELPSRDVSADGLRATLYLCRPSHHVLITVEFPAERLPDALEDWPALVARLRSSAELGPVLENVRAIGMEESVRHDEAILVCGFSAETAGHRPARVSRLIRDLACDPDNKPSDQSDRNECPDAAYGLPVSVYLFETPEQASVFEALALYTAMLRTALTSFSTRSSEALGLPAGAAVRTPRRGRREAGSRKRSRPRRRAGKTGPSFALRHQKALDLQADFTRFMGRYCVRTASSSAGVQSIARRFAEAYGIDMKREEAEQNWGWLRELICTKVDEEKLRRGRFVTAVLAFVAILALGEFIAQEISICAVGEQYTWESFLARDVYWSGGLLLVALIVGFWTYREQTLAAKIQKLRDDWTADRASTESGDAP